jgi:hypothetical protein
MAKCVYCDKRATTVDAVGLDACAAHEHKADEYHRKVTGRLPDTPVRQTAIVRALAQAVGPDFVDASDHPYQCTCNKCREWWSTMGPDPDTGLYGPFGASLPVPA